MNTATPLRRHLDHVTPDNTNAAASTKGHCMGHRLAGFMCQLRERKVCRAAAAYAILSWIILQLGEIAFPSLGLPPWTLTLVVVVAVAGFPVAMILAWILQWTDDGLVIDVPQGGGQSQSSRLDTVVNLVLLVAAATLSVELIWHNSMSDAQASATEITVEHANTIAIIPLTGADQAANGDAHTVEQFLRYELVNTQQYPLQMIAGISREQAFAPANGSVPLNWIVEGSVHTENGQIRLLLHLIELPNRRYLNSWSLLSDPETATAHQDLARTAAAIIVGSTQTVTLSSND